MIFDEQFQTISLDNLLTTLKHKSGHKRIVITVYFEKTVMLLMTNASIYHSTANYKGVCFDLTTAKWVMANEDDIAYYIAIFIESDAVDYANAIYPDRECFHVGRSS